MVSVGMAASPDPASLMRFHPGSPGPREMSGFLASLHFLAFLDLSSNPSFSRSHQPCPGLELRESVGNRLRVCVSHQSHPGLGSSMPKGN